MTTKTLTIRDRIYLLFHPRARRFRRACLAPWPTLDLVVAIEAPEQLDEAAAIEHVRHTLTNTADGYIGEPDNAIAGTTITVRRAP